MPGTEIRHAGSDHAGRVVKLLLEHAGSLPLWSRTQLFALQGVNDSSPIAPAVEVAVIESEHFTYESEFAFPQVTGGGPREVEGATFQEPEPVVPDPIAFGELTEEREDEGEVDGDEV